MRRIRVTGFLIALLALAALPESAQARHGLYTGLGFGFGGYTSSDPALQAGDRSSIQFSPAFRLGFNFFDYASLEAQLTGFGASLFDRNERQGGGHILGVAKLHPLAFTKVDTCLDPYVYLGAGYHIIGWQPRNDSLMKTGEYAGERIRGMDGPAIALGLGTDWYLLHWLSFGTAFNVVKPLFGRYFINYEDGKFARPVEGGGWHLNTHLYITFHFLGSEDLGLINRLKRNEKP
ncbi:MAG: hypothetical protein GMKNLPBB_01252 [Myxococcota bacterium]|nr:hypothetical protein [Myxococcota bacterium]